MDMMQVRSSIQFAISDMLEEAENKKLEKEINFYVTLNAFQVDNMSCNSIGGNI